MAGENSKILTGLPNLPPDYLDKNLWGEFLTVYRAIQNLLLGVSQYTGIDAPDSVEISQMDPTKYLLGANVEQWYPTAAVPITRGQVVRITGANTVNLAIATADANCAIGVADENIGAGLKGRVLLGGITTAIGGMVAGTKYYLSPTIAGAVQNLPPVAAGQWIQPIGYAMTANQMYLRVSSFTRVI